MLPAWRKTWRERVGSELTGSGERARAWARRWSWPRLHGPPYAAQRDSQPHAAGETPVLLLVGCSELNQTLYVNRYQ